MEAFLTDVQTYFRDPTTLFLSASCKLIRTGSLKYLIVVWPQRILTLTCLSQLARGIA
ncbi:hypothetical protein BIW11_04359 [Tropilaelaps mercedesae]|uniref:Uncharacterized protein n=1 Tax=Tropilaelaps mercedesae TaxID=418985 RepID=A0A1V9X807_9ACAR|nr:hypothetical protein BIW11_04359 [Tropilaelaps mercedesae]